MSMTLSLFESTSAICGGGGLGGGGLGGAPQAVSVGDAPAARRVLLLCLHDPRLAGPRVQGRRGRGRCQRAAPQLQGERGRDRGRARGHARARRDGVRTHGE